MKKVLYHTVAVSLIGVLLSFMGCSNSILSPDPVATITGNLNKVTGSGPSSVNIDLQLYFTGPNTAEGNFNMSGAAEDEGSVYEEFRITPGMSGTAHGMKILTVENGQFEIHFQVQITPTSPTTAVAEGQFMILNGSGSYEGFHGQGNTYFEIDFAAGTLAGTYEGNAFFDRR